MKRASALLVAAVFSLLVAARAGGQEPAPSPAAAVSASPAPAPGLEFHGLRLGSSRADVEEILRSKHIDFKEDAIGRLRLAGSPDPNLLPAPEVSHLVFDFGNRLVLIDLRWPLVPTAPDPFDQLLRGLSARFGPTKRTGGRDYWWDIKDPKPVTIHLYENLRRPGGRGTAPAPETAVRYLEKGAVVAQGTDRLD